MNGGTATISNCPGTTTTAKCNTQWLNTSESYPQIIYVQNATGCTSNHLPTSYQTNSQGQYFGACGDVYVHGYYTSP